MFYQNDEKINSVHRWGCYFCSILAMDELVSKVKFTDKEVMDLWGKNFKEGDIDIESTILDPQGLCNDLKAQLKFMGKYPATYTPSSDELQILVYHNDITAITHFVLGDNKGSVLYDPYPNSRTVKEGKVIGKRIFKRSTV
jgi:hypothetical protein